MKRKEFKEKIKELLDFEVDSISWSEKVSIVKQVIVEVEIERGFDTSNKGSSWTDDELRTVLRMAPTKENCLLLAKSFRRGYGSIEQIFRWASEDQKTIDQKRPDDTFIKQIKKIAKEVGWRAT